MKKVIDKAVEVLTHKKPRAPLDAAVYDVVIVGSNLGAALSKNFSSFTHGHKTMFVVTQVNEQPLDSSRVQYERTFISKIKYMLKTSGAVCTSAATSAMVPMSRLVPEENRLELRNGRSIGYRQLVLAMGLAPDWEVISGLREALANPEAPVYANYDLPSAGAKYKEFAAMASGGDIFFYIPPFPFGGEIESMNLLVALDTFRQSVKTGIMSELYKVHVINANDTFAAHSPLLNKFIEERLAADGKVHVRMRTRLTGVDIANEQLTLQDESGSHQKCFHRLHVQMPSKPHEVLQQSGLCGEKSLQVPVDPHLLNHALYSNVYAVGDVAQLPLQRSFLAGIHQNHVVRHNVLEALGGQRPNARYEGQSEFPLYTGNDEAVGYRSRRYGEESLRWGGRFPGLQYKLFYCTGFAKKLIAIASGKSPGPPRYKLGYAKFPSKVAKEKHGHADPAHH